MEAVELILSLGGIGLILWLLHLISNGQVKNFSVSIKDWLSVKAEGHSKDIPASTSAHSITREIEEPSILDQVHRFKRVMAAHGMRPEHWSRFFTACEAPFSIKRTDQLSDESLLNWIDDEKVNWLCETFRLNREWMDGEHLSMPHKSFYWNKRPRAFFDDIESELKDLPESFRRNDTQFLFALNRYKQNAESDTSARILVSVAIPLCQLSSELTVYRYIVDHAAGGYPWHNSPYREHIKILTRLSHLHFSAWTYGLYFEEDHFDAVDGGEMLMPEALDKPGHHHCKWHPEDYGLASSESAVAKETEQLPSVLKWMQAENLPAATTINRFQTQK